MMRSSFLRNGAIRPSQFVLNPSKLYLRNSVIGVSNVRFNSTEAAAAATKPIATEAAASASEITSQLASFTEETSNTAALLTSDTIGYLQSVGLPGNWFMGIFEHTLEYVHVYTGLPWWLTIVVSTLLFRLALFPLSIKTNENMARNAKAKPELDAVKARINDPSLTMREKQLLQQQMFAVMKKHGVKHRYLLVPIAQMATSIGLFVSIREMCLLPVQGFNDQGAYWFPDLVASDPYAALPIISALIYTLSIRRGGENGEMAMPGLFKKIMTFMPIASIPFTMQLSAGVGLYLTTSAVFTATQMFLFSNKSTRKALGLSPLVKPAVTSGSTAAKPEQGVKESLTGWVEKIRENSESKAKQFEQVSEAHKLAKLTRLESGKLVIRKRRGVNTNKDL